MAEVFEAAHAESGRRVAVKILRRQLEDDEAAVARFLEETRLSAAIRHPGLVAVEGAGVVEGTLYLATEFVDGESLDARLGREGPLSATVACEIAAQLLEALGALHEAGVIHRDVKPANVLVGGRPSDPLVKLLDLGIATWRDETARAMRDQVLTPAGHVMGTPDYVSPESLAHDAEPDPRSDLYSVGVLLFETLTGGLPFRAANLASLLELIVVEPAPLLRSVRADASPALEQVVAWALTKDPERRPQNAGEMLRSLAPLRRRRFVD